MERSTFSWRFFPFLLGIGPLGLVVLTGCLEQEGGRDVRGFNGHFVPRAAAYSNASSVSGVLVGRSYMFGPKTRYALELMDLYGPHSLEPSSTLQTYNTEIKGIAASTTNRVWPSWFVLESHPQDGASIRHVSRNNSGIYTAGIYPISQTLYGAFPVTRVCDIALRQYDDSLDFPRDHEAFISGTFEYFGQEQSAIFRTVLMDGQYEIVDMMMDIDGVLFPEGCLPLDTDDDGYNALYAGLGDSWAFISTSEWDGNQYATTFPLVHPGEIVEIEAYDGRIALGIDGPGGERVGFYMGDVGHAIESFDVDGVGAFVTNTRNHDRGRLYNFDRGSIFDENDVDIFFVERTNLQY